MPTLLVKNPDGRPARVTLAPDATLTLGRGPECEVVLPHASVSREHARVSPTAAGFVLEDLESQNGVLVNGWRLQGPHALKSGDELQIGHLHLVWIGDSREAAFYHGRVVAYLPPYRGGELPRDDEHTEAVSAEALDALVRGNRVLDHARLRDLKDPKRFWYPEERPLTFGKAGMVLVGGWFAGGICAEVSWDGRKHLLRRTAAFVTVSVNQLGIDSQALRVGDRVDIGDLSLVYEIADS
jgi:hypothetical protein